MSLFFIRPSESRGLSKPFFSGSGAWDCRLRIFPEPCGGLESCREPLRPQHLMAGWIPAYAPHSPAIGVDRTVMAESIMDAAISQIRMLSMLFLPGFCRFPILRLPLADCPGCPFPAGRRGHRGNPAERFHWMPLFFLAGFHGCLDLSLSCF